MKRKEKQDKKEVLKGPEDKGIREEEKAKESPGHPEELAGKEELSEQEKLLEKEGLTKEQEKLPKEVVLSYEEYKSIKEKSDLADQYFDRLLRMQAESDNLKKRLMKERVEFVRYANEELIAQLIGVIDNFERATESAKRTEDFKSLSQGVEMIAKDLQELLEKKGLAKINDVGAKFDPARHEAMEQVITERHPEDTVVEVMRKGYALNDRIIRPAAVKVSKRPEGTGQKAEDAEQKS